MQDFLEALEEVKPAFGAVLESLEGCARFGALPAPPVAPSAAAASCTGAVASVLARVSGSPAALCLLHPRAATACTA